MGHPRAATTAIPRRSRPSLIAPACVLALLAMCDAWPGSAALAAQRTITYAIAQQGDVGGGMREFAAVVRATLNDSRGWSVGGSLGFKRAARGRFTITLASPEVLESFAGAGCTRVYSCRVGPRVMINAERWMRATPTYPGPSLLHAYRQMVINHEVGHALGFGHANCDSALGLASVMQQQSKQLGGCERNRWPLPGERRTLASRHGVTTRPPAPGLVLGRRAGSIELGVRRSEVAGSLGAPTGRVFTPTGTREKYADPQLEIVYVSGRVQAITTRSPDDLTGKGLSVGTSLPRLRSTLAGEQCLTSPGDGLMRCVWYRGQRPSTFVLRNELVTAIRVELAPTSTAPVPPPAAAPAQNGAASGLG